MPHSVQDEGLQSFGEDDMNIEESLQQANIDADKAQHEDAWTRADFGVGQERADDAEDYEDIELSDEDEEALNGHAGANGQQHASDDDLFGAQNVDATQADDSVEDLFGESVDDLFGDGGSSPPPQTNGATNGLQFPGANIPRTTSLKAGHSASDANNLSRSPSLGPVTPEESQPTFRDVDYGTPEDDDPRAREQRELFEQAQRGREERLRRAGLAPGPHADFPTAIQTEAELFESVWYNFEKDKPPRWVELLPQKRAFYNAKKPLKPPKPIQPTKVSLDLQQDQERTFRLTAGTASNKITSQEEAQQRGLIITTDGKSEEQRSDDEVELDEVDEDEVIGGVTWQDFNMLSVDWNLPTPESMSDNDQDWDVEAGAPPAKKRKTMISKLIEDMPIHDDMFPSLEDPETTAAKLARKVHLDMNDPHLLIQIQQPEEVQQKSHKPVTSFRRDVSGSLNKAMARRYNISNDAAYDALKENHHKKIRSTLGTIAVEHSLPALKLQYPFYKVDLDPRETRSFHRPILHFHSKKENKMTSIPIITFKANKRIKRKELKGQDAQTIFNTSEDLSLRDNSDVLLLEYSEEFPTMLSNFGMGNRIINYYRKKDQDDTERPKREIGETQVLLPEDKSPFSMFGSVEPGQTVPTLHNAMFRAPVFEHNAPSTDFLVGKTTTGTEGNLWYMRNVQNIFVVGQEFPSVEVPGTHSRKVTEAAKKRLKMISYRIYRKNYERLHPRDKDNGLKKAVLTNQDILEHLPGSDIAGNRGKMREFMAYQKEIGNWGPKAGETIPDELTTRPWIRPEDICLLDSMQVGRQRLRDAGFDQDDKGKEEDDEADDEEGGSTEKELLPWKTTKNFLNACQGKAMLQLHGEGDPSGRGEAFSFIKTSMKGGFKALGETAQEKMDAKRSKEFNGHSYNVAKQQKAYEATIKKIWEAQETSLSSKAEHSDYEMDIDDYHEEREESVFGRGRTPQSQIAATPASLRRDDDMMSSFSRNSRNNRQGRVLKITRRQMDEYGSMETVTQIIRDPKTIREYTRRRREKEDQTRALEDFVPTGDEEVDARNMKRIQDELERLERNKERRHVREKQKAKAAGRADDGDEAGGKGAGTQRRCANCGQVGHIKTNKKCALDPFLQVSNNGFSAALPAPSPAPAPLPSPSPTSKPPTIKLKLNTRKRARFADDPSPPPPLI